MHCTHSATPRVIKLCTGFCCRLHYKVDAPLMISSVFYIGQSHTEKFGVARLEPNVHLYCKYAPILPCHLPV